MILLTNEYDVICYQVWSYLLSLSNVLHFSLQRYIKLILLNLPLGFHLFFYYIAFHFNSQLCISSVYKYSWFLYIGPVSCNFNKLTYYFQWLFWVDGIIYIGNHVIFLGRWHFLRGMTVLSFQFVRILFVFLCTG